MKNSYPDKTSLAPTGVGDSGNGVVRFYSELMNLLINTLVRIGLLKKDLDYHLVRASMEDVVLFAVSFYLLKQDLGRAARATN